MNTNHTPGPWTAYGALIHGGDKGRHVLARITTQVLESTERANARLIAAAPDLLEVAQMAASSLKVDEIALMDAARAAIRKATT